MTLAEISVQVGGILSLLMAIFHSRFYKLFKWKTDFKYIGPLNSKIHYTIHIALLIIFIGFSAISLLFSTELAKCSGLSLGLMVLFSTLWFWRTAWQVFYFKPLFKGKKTPVAHWLLTIHFGSLFVSYTIPIVLKLL